MATGLEGAVAAFTLLMLGVAFAQPPPHPPSQATADGDADVLPGCPADCGGVHIPYPFGIGSDCFLPVDPAFRINCSSNKPYITDYHNTQYQVTNISLTSSTLVVLAPTPPICNSSWTYRQLWNSWNLRLSPSGNDFTVLGCDVLAIFSGYTYYKDYNVTSGKLPFINETVGCVSTCPLGINQMGGGVCNGIRCCQTSVEIGTWSYATAVRKIDGADISSISNISRCYRAFLVEKGKFDFAGASDRVDAGESIAYPLLVDWSMGDKDIRSCEEAVKNRSRYACLSRNSVCLNSTSWGYSCRCAQGYEGNPYLAGGCRDIDECKLDSGLCGNLVCHNQPGNYTCMPLIPQNNSTKTTLAIALGVGSSATLLFLFAVVALCYTRWQKRRRIRERRKHFFHNHDMLRQQLLMCSNEVENVIKMVNFFTLKELNKATNNFDRSHIVGQGGHGTVYKGLMDLRVVAIKKSKVTVQSEIEGFINEIILLSQISHRNVVKLVGCCFEAEVPLLVYEFISNGTLADHLHIWNRDTPLSWEDRLRIAIEISGALSYLHSSASISIFHRDIKSANILLDDKLTAKVSDFGASKFIEMDQTHVSTNIQGTLGYLDPEYMHTGQLTEKSDVYSLGVILVELVTGEKPTSKTKSQEERNLISHFIGAFKENKLFQVVEASIVDDDTIEEITLVAGLAMDCLRLRGMERPTMKEVEVTLQGLRKNKAQKKLKAVAPKYDPEQVQSISYYSSSYSRSEDTKQSMNSTWTSR